MCASNCDIYMTDTTLPLLQRMSSECQANNGHIFIIEKAICHTHGSAHKNQRIVVGNEMASTLLSPHWHMRGFDSQSYHFAPPLC